jgi:hypothetical protein
MAGKIISSLRACALGLAISFSCAAQAQAPTRPSEAVSLCETIWQVTASWSDHQFYWVFWRDGRYTDTDGPTGGWNLESGRLTLTADSGFIYRATLTGEKASGTVHEGAASVGTFTAQRTYAGNCARPGA